MDPIHPILPVSPGIAQIAPAKRSERVQRDPRRQKETPEHGGEPRREAPDPGRASDDEDGHHVDVMA
jgi:hypothetical protein